MRDGREPVGKESAGRRRDDALRRALAMPPVPHKNAPASANVTIVADADDLLAYLADARECALEVPAEGLELPADFLLSPEELVAVDVDSDAAAGAGEVLVRLKPSPGFLRLMAAARAGDRDG